MSCLAGKIAVITGAASGIGNATAQVLGDETYQVHKGMSVFIPENVHHQSFNDGDEDLVYYFIFAPPPGGTPKQEAQGWVKIRG